MAGSILTALYHMIRDGVPYRPPEPKPLNADAKAQKANRLAGQIRALEFDVKLQQAA